MFAEFLFVAAIQIGPFYEERADYSAVRPFWSQEADRTDVLWPVWTAHRGWWRFLYFTQYHEYADGGYQFDLLPLWFNGREGEDSYWGLFPLYGRHPHLASLNDLEFALWPLWMRYRTPRPKEDRWLTTNAVLFPFFHWRDDGSWGCWPICGFSHNRADDHGYALWPLINWKTSFEDRDTGGAGVSWMFWPLYGRVDREREYQQLVLPPLFSYVETPSGWRGRYPWPLVEIERFRNRHRTSFFPFYEQVIDYRYYDGKETARATRFGWRLVELLPDETRVWPFYVGSRDYLRVWPFWEGETRDGVTYSRCLALFPIRWVDAVDRNWAKFWTFYESASDAKATRHSLLWGLIRWSTEHD